MTELDVRGGEQITLRGTAPAQNEFELADLMRAIGLDPLMVAATEGWLAGEKRTSAATRRGYSMDLSWWLVYCASRGLDPADVHPLEAGRYMAALREHGLSPATRARRKSAASSWYAYILRAGAVVRDPFAGMESPSVTQESKTRGLSKAQLDRMLAWAHQDAEKRRSAYEGRRGSFSRARDGARTYALLCLMVVTGCRVGGVIGAQLSGLGQDREHPVVDLPVTGQTGKTRRFPLPAYAAAALNAYLEFRGDDDGPLFRTDAGKPMAQSAIFRQIRWVGGKAKVPHAVQLSPRSLRHAVATYRPGTPGAQPHRVQEPLGHADPRTAMEPQLRAMATDSVDPHKGPTNAYSILNP
ncbi:hypothetical protein GCM10010404_04800 [Nonomuraea africana]|uniref:Site-specific recombinase XerD n=1 Tax=Nonomuraea africana TaxID=46171 RepID=A0ABR9KC60_9ACTN|nr:tyrosine-type recombinase/integrase [Nonomuraea africana]MBE1559137.1 site-specific recombinase XerD [Nonomuraea africana]